MSHLERAKMEAPKGLGEKSVSVAFAPLHSGTLPITDILKVDAHEAHDFPLGGRVHAKIGPTDWT